MDSKIVKQCKPYEVMLNYACVSYYSKSRLVTHMGNIKQYTIINVLLLLFYLCDGFYFKFRHRTGVSLIYFFNHVTFSEVPIEFTTHRTLLLLF